MTALKNIPSRIGGAVLIAAGVGLTAGPALAFARPQPSGANLTIDQNPGISSHWFVEVSGVFPMGEYEAHGFINNINSGKYPGGTVIHIFGADRDDVQRNYVVPHQFFPGAGYQYRGHLYAASDGVHYSRVLNVAKTALDERDGPDEIYAEAMFLDANSEVRGQQYSNVVTVDF
jgi:hypothetical protein